MFPTLIECGWVFHSKEIHGKGVPKVNPGFLKTQSIPKP